MDDIVIDDVLEVIDDVSIEEIVYKEEGRLRLAREQIEQEIGNLIAGHGKYMRRIKLFSRLFESPQSPVPVAATIAPVVSDAKFMHEDDFKPDSHYKIDAEFDAQNNVKGKKIVDFLEMYSKLNRDRESPYPHAARALYASFRPYDFSSSRDPVARDVDCVWSTRREFSRLIGPISIDLGHRPDVIDADYLKEHSCPQGRKYIDRSLPEVIYGGDAPTIVAYENVVDESAPFKTFDLGEYKRALRMLEPGQRVEIAFNTIAFDKRRALVERLGAKVAENTGASVRVELDKTVRVGVETLAELEIPFDRYYPAYCYRLDFEPKFAKRDLLTQNYRFAFTNVKYIIPQTWSEYAHLAWRGVATPERLMRAVGFENAEIDMLPALHSSEKRADAPYVPPSRVRARVPSRSFFDFSENADLLRDYEEPYRLSSASFDGELARCAYLRNLPDGGIAYAFSFAENRRIDAASIEDALAAVDRSLSSLAAPSGASSKPPRLAKRYASVSALEADNGKVLYYDEALDPTRYDLKVKSGLEGRALEAYLSKELGGDAEEIEAIVAGKRQVREGDLAAVDSAGHAITYRWARVGKSRMWVKTNAAPTCSSEEASFSELEAKTAMVIDSYDDLCKKASDAALSRKRAAALEASRALHEALESARENRSRALDRLRDALQIRRRAGFSKRAYNAMIGYVDKVSYDEYYGDESSALENMYMNFAFGAGPTAMNYPTGPAAPEPEQRTIADVICRALELEGFTEEMRKYVNDYLEEKLPDASVNNEIEKRLQELNKQVEKLLIENRKKPAEVQRALRIKLEAKKIQMIEEERTKRLFPHSFEKVALCCATMILIIMIKHPLVSIRRLAPGCVRHFSYLAYPLQDENAPRSLIKYVACVLKALHQPKDARFALVGDEDANAKAILVSIKKILHDKSDIKKHVESKKISEEAPVEEISYDRLNVFFKPCFDFARSSYDDPIVQYVKEIHSAVSKAKISRYNFANLPLVSNACCVELLDAKTNFYDFFDGEYFKRTKDKANEAGKSDARPPKAWTPPSVSSAPEDVFSKKKLVPSSTVEIEKKPEFVPSAFDDRDASWWDDVGHPENIANFSYLESLMPKTGNIQRARKLFVEISDLSNVSALRNAYASYLRGALRAIVGKLANGYRFDKTEKVDKSDPFVSLLETANAFDRFRAVMKVASADLEALSESARYDSSSQVATNAIRDVMRFTRKLCEFAMRTLWVSTGAERVDSIDAPRLSLALARADASVTKPTIQAVHLIFERLAEHAEANYFDLAEVKKDVEMLREKRKLEIMAKYSADDEERNQQILLKKMGYEKWDEVEEAAAPAAAEPEPPVVEPARAEYVAYVDDRGENADEDVDHEGYD